MLNRIVESDSIIIVKHELNSSTMKKELNAIKQEAIDAGIDFTYKVKYKKKQIRKFQYECFIQMIKEILN